jgi:hypothetical protein
MAVLPLFRRQSETRHEARRKQLCQQTVRS